MRCCMCVTAESKAYCSESGNFSWGNNHHMLSVIITLQETFKSSAMGIIQSKDLTDILHWWEWPWPFWQMYHKLAPHHWSATPIPFPYPVCCFLLSALCSFTKLLIIFLLPAVCSLTDLMLCILLPVLFATVPLPPPQSAARTRLLTKQFTKLLNICLTYNARSSKALNEPVNSFTHLTIVFQIIN